jgi:hypothetical protein
VAARDRIVTKLCKEPEVKPTRRIAIVAAVALLVSCIPTNPGDKPGWGLFPGATGVNGTGSTPGVLVLGDSLVFGANVQTLADMIRFWRGTNAVVAAAGGASFAHFNKATLIGPSGLATVQNYVDFFQPLRVTVLALGSNDARIITGEASDPYGYRLQEYREQALISAAAALSHSSCVVLINVADHWAPIASSAVVAEINAGLAALDAASTQIFTHDWNAFSAPHPEWFAAPNDIHHSPAGQAAYRDFINDAVASAMASGC